MLAKLLIACLALLVTACVPIPAVPPTQHADCSNNHLAIRVGQSAPDPTLDSLPGYIDIVGVTSHLEDENLTAIFHLKHIPQELEFNRNGVKNTALEYMWTVAVNIEDTNTAATFDQADYHLVTFYPVSRASSDTPSQTRPFSNAVITQVWKREDAKKNEAVTFVSLTYARMLISHEENTLTLIGIIPGITPQSTLTFSTDDILAGHDWVSCQPS